MECVLEAFVYCWSNLTNGKIYVGYHKGKENDGYVCSSRNPQFWEDFENPKMEWSRQIVGRGTTEECKTLEVEIQKQLLTLRESCYNLVLGKRYVGISEEGRKRISNTSKKFHNTKEQKKKASVWGKRNKGRKHTKEVIEQISKAAQLSTQKMIEEGTHNFVGKVRMVDFEGNVKTFPKNEREKLESEGWVYVTTKEGYRRRGKETYDYSKRKQPKTQLGKVYVVNKEKTVITILKEELPLYKEKGWATPNSKVGRGYLGKGAPKSGWSWRKNK